MKAFMDARNLAINAVIFEKDVIGDILARAYSEMLALASHLSEEALDEDIKQRLAKAPKKEVVKEEKEEKVEEKEEEEEEESKEEEALEGLGALFG